MNDVYAQSKLHNNMRVIAECEQIAAGQVAAVRVIIGQIGANLGRLEGEIASLKASIQAERKFIFDSVRVFFLLISSETEFELRLTIIFQTRSRAFAGSY